MSDFLPLGGAVVDLSKVEAVLLDEAVPPTAPGRPGSTRHRVLFHVGDSRHDSRALVIDPASPEGVALKRWATGLDGEVSGEPIRLGVA